MANYLDCGRRKSRRVYIAVRCCEDPERMDEGCATGVVPIHKVLHRHTNPHIQNTINTSTAFSLCLFLSLSLPNPPPPQPPNPCFLMHILPATFLNVFCFSSRDFSSSFATTLNIFRAILSLHSMIPTRYRRIVMVLTMHRIMRMTMIRMRMSR